MAIAATAVWECRTTGDDTNGGGWDSASGGVDKSQQNAAQVVIDNATITATCNGAVITFTGGTYTVLAGDKGNIVNMISGTGLTVKRYQISSVSAGLNGTWTLDSTTSMSGGAVTSAKMGGAIVSPALAAAANILGNTVFLQNSGAVFPITNATSNVTNGTISAATSIVFQGYSSTRTLGNSDAPPTIQLQVSTATMWASGGATVQVQNIICDGNSQTTSKAYASGTFIQCQFTGFQSAPAAGSGVSFYRCYSTTNAVTIFLGTAILCEANANTATGFSVTSADGCISSNNTGVSSIGLSVTAQAGNIANCIAYGNGSHGFNATGAFASNYFINCHAENNTGAGFNLSNQNKGLRNCSTYNNSGGTVSSSGTVTNVGFITVTAGSVFVNAAGGNFALNNTANQGALLRAAGDPATFPRGLTANYRDIGAAQHQDSGGTTINIFPVFD